MTMSGLRQGRRSPPTMQDRSKERAMVTEAVLNAFGEQLKDLTLCKTRYDLGGSAMVYGGTVLEKDQHEIFQGL